MTLLPEVELLSLLILTVKLFHPFDKLERHVASASDIGVLTIDWDKWIQTQKTFAEKRDKDPWVRRSKNIDVQETDIHSMSGSQLDEYLDWFEETWNEEDESDNGPGDQDILGQLEALFPTGRPVKPAVISKKDSQTAELDATIQKLTATATHLKLRQIIHESKATRSSDPKPRRICSYYKPYKSVEGLPAAAKAFFTAAAQYAGISPEYLVAAVYSIEVALVRKDDEGEEGSRSGEEADISEDDMEYDDDDHTDGGDKSM